ncbi:multiple sugar transport system ATP-binding protein [Mesorhizobium muleiense]|uniref:Multiple sugar transport system ATP-binding protein n=1 Tax=Mesorhizobium muleiense TaxID=1004279 RepID=A0A1G9CKE7_9HYPH|nr:multiple sugar transport system ATP-binding protein [Mesorhizobium muleiense]
MSALMIRDLHKSYGGLEILAGINLEARTGEFVALVGPSGCGKSTLLAMIAGLETVTSGEIWIGDRLVNSVQPKDRDIAMVFQSYALYPTMTVRQNITFGMESRGVPKAEQAEAVKRVAALLQIEQLLNRKPGQLSGGQRQRVAMGRALVRDPNCFCSTSRCPISTPSCASTCAPKSRSFTIASARRRCTSLTIRSRR